LLIAKSKHRGWQKPVDKLILDWIAARPDVIGAALNRIGILIGPPTIGISLNHLLISKSDNAVLTKSIEYHNMYEVEDKGTSLSLI
jgi:hypothetical protein